MRVSVVLSIARREWDEFFTTAIGWLVMLGFSTISGLTFVLILSDATDPAYLSTPVDVNTAIIPAFFGTIQVLLLLLAPAISMRSYSADFSQQSFVMLLAAPVSSAEIVMGKFLGAMGYLLSLYASLLHCLVVLFWLSDPSLTILALNLLASVASAACFLAIGQLMSSWTSSQLLALGTSFAILIGLWFFEAVGIQIGGAAGDVLRHLSPLGHIETLSQGLIQLKDCVYFASTIALALYATQQRIERLRWL